MRLTELSVSGGRACKASLRARRRGLFSAAVGLVVADGVQDESMISLDRWVRFSSVSNPPFFVSDVCSGSSSRADMVVGMRIRCSSEGTGEIPWCRSKLACFSNADFTSFTWSFGTRKASLVPFGSD